MLFNLLSTSDQPHEERQENYQRDIDPNRNASDACKYVISHGIAFNDGIWSRFDAGSVSSSFTNRTSTDFITTPLLK
jgi:hypothetical protein